MVFLSVYDDEQYVFEALRAGAGGYLLKRVDGPELVRRLEEVARGETVVDPTLAGRMAVTAARLTRGEFWPGANRGLTQRESEVLSLLVGGLSNKAIAARLVLSEETVKSHLRALYRKLEVTDRSAAIAVALREACSGDVPAGAACRSREDLLVRVVAVACSDRELPRMADELACLVVRSARALTFCDVYVLDEEERALEWSGPPVPLGEGDCRLGRRARPGPPAPGRARRRDPRARRRRRDRGRGRPVRPDAARGPGARHRARRAVRAGAVVPLTAAHRAEREHAAERFAERAVEAQEAERSRLSREIHDGIAQRLASLGFHLSAAEGAARAPSGGAGADHDGAAAVRAVGRRARAAIGGCGRPSWTIWACRRRSPRWRARPGTVPDRRA